MPTSQLSTSAILPSFTSAYQQAEREDAADPLHHIRYKFSHPPDTTYLCGNSLGLQPHAARHAVTTELDRWATQGVHAHFSAPTPWVDAEREAAAVMEPIVGARPGEVAVMNSLTLNLHLMLTAFYRPHGNRVQIMIEDGAFSSDEYAVQTHVRARGLCAEEVIERIGGKDGESVVRDEDVVEAIRKGGREGRLALVLFGGVQYYTGQVFGMKEICEAGREVGVVVGFDLAHAVGNVELRLHDWGADFAVWCCYKYLNGGPGAVAGCFVHGKYMEKDLKRLGGWWGHERESRFLMGREFVAQKGAAGFQLSNPPILALVGVTAAGRVFEEAGGMGNVRAKSIKLTGFLDKLLREKVGNEVDVVTPAEVENRGAQLSLRLWRVREWMGGSMRDFNARLERRGVVCDVREPDVLRVAPAPLYNSFRDVARFVEVLKMELDCLK